MNVYHCQKVSDQGTWTLQDSLGIAGDIYSEIFLHLIIPNLGRSPWNKRRNEIINSISNSTQEEDIWKVSHPVLPWRENSLLQPSSNSTLWHCAQRVLFWQWYFRMEKGSNLLQSRRWYLPSHRRSLALYWRYMLQKLRQFSIFLTAIRRKNFRGTICMVSLTLVY